MNLSHPGFSLKVDLLNPGEFFACCGIFELVHRLRPGAEAWFADDPDRLCVRVEQEDDIPTADLLRDQLARCRLDDLMTDQERSDLDALKRVPRRQLPVDLQKRRSELESQEREAPIFIGEPFRLRLDWWTETEENGGRALKTWAGRQSVREIAQSMQEAHGKAGCGDIGWFDYVCTTSREPFYFDARRMWTALDAGFSADTLGLAVETRPAVELLALVGLQRFRPRIRPTDDLIYCTWGVPCLPAVARAAACGAISLARRRVFRFSLYNRDRKGRYKGFSYAQEERSSM